MFPIWPICINRVNATFPLYCRQVKQVLYKQRLFLRDWNSYSVWHQSCITDSNECASLFGLRANWVLHVRFMGEFFLPSKKGKMQTTFSSWASADICFPHRMSFPPWSPCFPCTYFMVVPAQGLAVCCGHRTLHCALLISSYPVIPYITSSDGII